VKPDSIGNAATCECGQQYRVTLVIHRLPIEIDSVLLRGQRVCVGFWNWCIVTWPQSIWPRTLAFSRSVREKWFPAAVNTMTDSCRNIAERINSIFATPNSAAPMRAISTAEQPASAGTIPIPSETPDERTYKARADIEDEPTSTNDFFSTTSGHSVSGQTLSESTSESQKHYRLANQMFVAGLHEDAYAHASRAVVLDPSNAGAWAIKGIAAVYSSKPPKFRLNESHMCLKEFLKSDRLKEFLPSLQQHLIRASSHYRKLVRQACQDAVDDAQREPLAGNVDVGLQLTLRNKRVARVQTEKHRDGYFASIKAIRYAAGLNPTFHVLALGLKEIDNVLSKESFPGFINFLSEDGKRDEIVRLREGFVMKMREIRPGFMPPEIPRASGCFIATAATGDEFHPSVCTLRCFRDQILLPTSIGRRFVRAYYRMSPPLAAAIRRAAWQRWLVFATIVLPLSMVAEYIMLKKQSALRNREKL
jgi:hypothetical protein